MWPKILFELLPHLTRLVPMADKYLSTRTASERAQEAALAALGAEVRGELGQLGEVHTGIQRQLQDQGVQLSELAVEVTRARMGVENMESRVAAVERIVTAMRWLVVASLVGGAGTIGLLVAVLEKLRAH
jgi:hypothetical protein